MKNLIITAFIFLTVNIYAQKIDTVRVYYIPWKLTSGSGPITEKEVRNYQDCKNYFIEFTKDSIIDDFVNSLLVFNLNSKSIPFQPDVRMVIDYISKDNKVYSILIDYNKYMWYLNNAYSINWKLMNVIKKYVPEKLALNGEIYIIKVKKGSITEEEINEWKSKGITIVQE